MGDRTSRSFKKVSVLMGILDEWTTGAARYIDSRARFFAVDVDWRRIIGMSGTESFDLLEDVSRRERKRNYNYNYKNKKILQYSQTAK